MIKKHYAGIGARSTPVEVQQRMTRYAEILEDYDFILRSGGAAGADLAFEAGVKDPRNKEILRPRDSTKLAEEIASHIHPAWGNCGWIARACHGRNVMQVLGQNISVPWEIVKFVVCWTPGAEAVGGSRTAIVVAQEHDVPVYNIADPKQQESFEELLSGLLHTEVTISLHTAE